MTQYFSWCNILSANKQLLNRYFKKCTQIQISRPVEGRRGVGRVFILDFQVNVANDMWNLGVKGLLHILLNPILLFFFSFNFT